MRVLQVLALTATATASVKEDVVQALGLVDCVIFRQSFNRPNLRFSVVPKTNKCVEDIDKFIKQNHSNECGIIYCLSRMDCEKVVDKLQVELVRLVRQQFSASHILDVYRGSVSQIVKKNKHDTLRLHGAGKHLGKAEASRVLRHLVVEEILVEHVKKSDYGSVSSVLKVNENKAGILLAGRQSITLRFRSADKPSKSHNNNATSVRGSLTSSKQSPLLLDSPDSDEPQQGVDLELSATIFRNLRTLRSTILSESGEGFAAHHIFSAKLNKYGDRGLETIETVLKEHNGNTQPDQVQHKRNKGSVASQRQPSLKNGSLSKSGKSSTDSAKRRRSGFKDPFKNSKDDDDFVASTARSKKRAVENPNPSVDPVDSFNDISEEELYFYASQYDNASNLKGKENIGGRVLPAW